jgi:hypothetical protein
MADTSEKLISIIDERINKIINSMGLVQKYVGIVTAVSVDNKTITAVIAGYDTEFDFLNKSGELISVGDGVKIETDSSGLSGGYISAKFGATGLTIIPSGDSTSTGSLTASDNLILLQSYAADYNSRRQLAIGNNNITLANALKLMATTNGSTWNNYMIFGEHNYPYAISSYTGTYATSTSQTISLGFTPRRVLIGQNGGSYIYVDGQNSISLTTNGFVVSGTGSNNTGIVYNYIAFK